MKISIITVCFNSEETIRDTLESVIGQSYSNVEYIVVDGASNDSTLEIISEYSEKISQFVSEPDEGIYDAMNKGICMASGDYVGILNSDDIFSNKNSIKTLVDFIKLNNEADVFFGDLVIVERNNLEKVLRSYSSKGFEKWKIRFGFMCPHPTFYVRRDLFGKLGCYKVDYRVSADFELMARFFCAGVKFKRFSLVLVKMRYGGISNNGLLGRVYQNFEIVRACKENGIYTNILFVCLKIPFKLLSYFLGK